MSNIAIIGSGSWGIALAIHLAKLGNKIKVWSFMKEEADLINNEKKCKFLPNVNLPENIECMLNYEDVIKDSEYILHVTPSKVTRNIIKEYKKYITDQPIIMCSKGCELETLNTLEKVVLEEIPNANFAALSGPSHAEEVSVGIPTAIVIASRNNKLSEELQDLFMNENLRVYTSNDVDGVELGGAFKNIIAFCAGIGVGLGLGDNSYAALITRGLNEITNLGIKLGAKRETFYGLAGLGDLIVTCGSKHSRNRSAGMLLGQGKNINEIKQEIGMTIESIDNIEVAYKLSKVYDVEMPIVETIYDVLYNGLEPKQGLNRLMTRNKRSE